MFEHNFNFYSIVGLPLKGNGIVYCRKKYLKCCHKKLLNIKLN